MQVLGSAGYPSSDRIKFQMKLSVEFYYVSLLFQSLLALAVIALFFLNFWNVVVQCRKSYDRDQANSKQQPKESQKQNPLERYQSNQKSVNSKLRPNHTAENAKLKNEIIQSVRDVEWNNASNGNTQQSYKSPSLVSQYRKKVRTSINKARTNQIIEIIDSFKIENSIEKRNQFEYEKQNKEYIRRSREKQQNSQHVDQPDVSSSNSQSQQEAQQNQKSQSQPQQQEEHKANMSQKISINLQNHQASVFACKTQPEQIRKDGSSDGSHQQMANLANYYIIDQDKFFKTKKYQKFVQIQGYLIYLLSALSVSVSVLCIVKTDLISIYGVIPALLICFIHKMRFFRKLRWTLHISVLGFIAPAIQVYLGKNYLI